MTLWKPAAAAALTFSIAMAGAAPAFASGSSLKWTHPDLVTSGVPVPVASLDNCPPPPTAGDSILVQVNLVFTGGGSGQVLPANPDGSWSGSVTFNFPGVTSKHVTINAECTDFTGFSATPYAQYKSTKVSISD
ncbi:MAG TPA: hypothetical protein VG435_18380 [Acidimicrobiales bacterium]|jgi:hypothetical protein|nr:hypothetical protein [Acidimicrobiales bacterium]